MGWEDFKNQIKDNKNFFALLENSYQQFPRGSSIPYQTYSSNELLGQSYIQRAIKRPRYLGATRIIAFDQTNKVLFELHYMEPNPFSKDPAKPHFNIKYWDPKDGKIKPIIKRGIDIYSYEDFKNLLSSQNLKSIGKHPFYQNFRNVINKIDFKNIVILDIQNGYRGGLKQWMQNNGINTINDVINYINKYNSQVTHLTKHILSNEISKDIFKFIDDNIKAFVSPKTIEKSMAMVRLNPVLSREALSITTEIIAGAILGDIAGVAAGVITGVVEAPILLAGLAIAGGYGAYYLWKHYQSDDNSEIYENSKENVEENVYNFNEDLVKKWNNSRRIWDESVTDINTYNYSKWNLWK